MDRYDYTDTDSWTWIRGFRLDLDSYEIDSIGTGAGNQQRLLWRKTKKPKWCNMLPREKQRCPVADIVEVQLDETQLHNELRSASYLVRKGIREPVSGSLHSMAGQPSRTIGHGGSERVQVVLQRFCHVIALSSVNQS